MKTLRLPSFVFGPFPTDFILADSFGYNIRPACQSQCPSLLPSLTPMFSRPALHSPLPAPAFYRHPASEAETTYLLLTDASADGKITVEGAEAVAVLTEAWGVTGLAITAGAEIPVGKVYGLRPDLFFVHTAADAVAATLDALGAAVARRNAFVTVTDVTHGRAGIRVQGPGSTELLSRLCGLDFRPAAFPDGTARFSSLARTRQLLIRDDRDGLTTFFIFGPRSLGRYVWEAMELVIGNW